MSVKLIENKGEFDQQLTDAGEKLVVVDFFADWCQPCKAIAPKIKTMAEENSCVIFLKVNVDDSDDVASEYEVQALPTFLFFKNGKKLDDSVVGASEAKVKETIEKHK